MLTHVCHTLAALLRDEPASLAGWTPAERALFQRACRVHGVAQLLYEYRRALEDDDSGWLAAQFEHNRRRIDRLQTELVDILALLAAHHLPVMPLKGALLTANLYQPPALRPMADLDLLVAPADFERAATLLTQLGYQREVAHWKHTEFIKPDNRAVVDPGVEHRDNPRRVELHQACRESFGGITVDLTALMWQQASPGHLLGQPVSLPTDEALWLHLLVHATYHFWQGRGRLIQLVDLARLTPRLTRRPPLLDSVGPRFTYPALALVQRYFPAAIEPAWVAGQQKRVSPAFAAWVNTLNLVDSSYLSARPSGSYLGRALRFSGGRPAEVAQALRFALLPRLSEISLDHPRLAQSRAPWLAYALLPLDWLKRLGGNRE